jgi:hypothetical protein
MRKHQKIRRLAGSVLALLACATWSACGGSAHGDEGESDADQTVFAVVNADGTVRYSKGVDASNPLTTGKFPDAIGGYQVLFTRDVSKCAAVVNVRAPNSGVIPPAYAVVGRSSQTQVEVQIFDRDGHPFDSAFELAVIC